MRTFGRRWQVMARKTGMQVLKFLMTWGLPMVLLVLA
jgi:hypothetical protein